MSSARAAATGREQISTFAADGFNIHAGIWIRCPLVTTVAETIEGPLRAAQ
jgi:hypothetical protein